ncbi:hypothetical protein CLOM_g6985 [Closterium sp. NIES-68]|nr:hypothetical protein CLOM_g6985 [Closterium sp. NIES-68]
MTAACVPRPLSLSLSQCRRSHVVACVPLPLSVIVARRGSHSVAYRRDFARQATILLPSVLLRRLTLPRRNDHVPSVPTCRHVALPSRRRVSSTSISPSFPSLLVSSSSSSSVSSASSSVSFASSSVSSASSASSPSASSPSFTISASVTFLSEIKKSRFVAIAAPVGSPEEAMRVIEEVSDPSATHNCWAYKVSPAYRFNDDGEPGGTAGRPILAAIEGAGVDGVVVVVTRYYGGVKLGTGGLVRAYGGAASGALREATLVPVLKKVALRIVAPVHHVGLLYTLLQRPEYSVERLSESYSESVDGKGSVIELQILALADNVPRLQEALLDTLRGDVLIVNVE